MTMTRGRRRAGAVRPAMTVIALSAGLLLGACGVEQAATNDVDRTANAADERIDEVAADAGTAVESLADGAKALTADAAGEAKETVGELTPDARALARKAEDGVGRLADATGEAAIKAGSAVAGAGREVARKADQATDDLAERDNRTARQ